jgi:hypothetical protein
MEPKPKKPQRDRDREIILEIDGDRAAVYWWTREAAAILAAIGTAKGIYQGLNDNPWCG